MQTRNRLFAIAKKPLLIATLLIAVARIACSQSLGTSNSSPCAGPDGVGTEVSYYVYFPEGEVTISSWDMPGSYTPISSSSTGRTVRWNEPVSGNVWATLSNGQQLSLFVTAHSTTPPAPTISASNTNFCPGTGITFSLVQQFVATVSWQVNNVEVQNGGSQFTTFALQDNDVVKAIVTSSSPCVTSGPVASNEITVHSKPVAQVSILKGSDPARPEVFVCPGANVQFTVPSGGAGMNPEYQWYINGVRVYNTDPMIPNSRLVVDPWNYQDVSVKCVVISDGYCDGEAVIQARTTLDNTIISDLPAGTRCQGSGTTQFSVNSNIPVSYTWDMTGASSTISSGGLATWSPTYHGTAYIYATPDGCDAKEIFTTVSVLEAPAALTERSLQFCDWETPVIVSGSWFNLYDNNGTLIREKISSFELPRSAALYSRQYKLEALDGFGCTSISKATYTVSITDDCDEKLNWIESISYNDAHSVISNSRSYFDFSGHGLQTQSKSFTPTAKHQGMSIFATQSLEDTYGRIAASTLPAPTLKSTFQYNHYFVRASATERYEFSNFDEYSKKLNPDAVNNKTAGTLGWYYSTYNNVEDHVPATSFPYSRTEFYDDGTGEVKRSAAPGDFHRLGTGHEVLSGTFPVYNELDDYLSKRRNLLQIPDNLDNITSLVKRGVQSVVRDQNGNIAVSIADQSGNTVISARKGTAQDNVLSVPVSITSTLDPVDVNYRPITYFYLLNDGPVSISSGNNYVVEDIVSGTIFSVPTNNIWTAGFYRIILSSGSVTLSYTNHFLNVSYQFYDDAGRLKSSLSPNGFKQLKDNSGLSYAQVDQTSYTYNHQGRLLSMKEPDAGTTNYQYRRDGKIRFSQNAEQAKTERNDFSYTHYDALGRPTESGEYFGTQYTFATLQTQLEHSQQIVFPGSAIRDWVKTHYDKSYYDELATNIPNLPTQNNRPTLEFIQEFVRGAVSWTENANIQTWYSYDEFGRVVWMAQKPNVLNRTFVTRYAYDFLGNVLIVKNTAFVNGSEITTETFYHHYTYDADQRLFQAFTSTDGTNKKLRATYEYYLHGPLKRIELGDKLQGIDFVYNINGWLTQINHPSKDKIKDPGQDGGALHPDVLPDVFGMVLDYYESDLADLYAVGSGPAIQNLHQIHSLPFSNDQSYANHQPLIRFEQITDPSSGTPTNLMKQYSADNPRYKKLLSSD